MRSEGGLAASPGGGGSVHVWGDSDVQWGGRWGRARGRPPRARRLTPGRAGGSRGRSMHISLGSRPSAAPLARATADSTRGTFSSVEDSARSVRSTGCVCQPCPAGLITLSGGHQTIGGSASADPWIHRRSTYSDGIKTDQICCCCESCLLRRETSGTRGDRHTPRDKKIFCAYLIFRHQTFGCKKGPASAVR